MFVLLCWWIGGFILEIDILIEVIVFLMDVGGVILGLFSVWCGFNG